MSNYESLLDYEPVQKLLADIETSLQPAWIRHLIDNAFIEQDGKTVICSLDEIAKEIKNYLNRQIKKAHLERFIQRDGNPFAENTIKNAVTDANKPD